MGRNKKYTIHSFYCPNCGKKTLDLPRSLSSQKESMHRKKMYCPWCKETLNQIEVKNDQEYFNFKTAFERGDFKGEVADSLSYVWAPGIGQDDILQETDRVD